MTIYEIGYKEDKKALLESIGVDKGGIPVLSDKMETLWILIKNMKTPAANILKQDALSIGADLAVPSGVITCEVERVDAVLIATRKHLKLLSKKEKAQPFGLKNLAKRLEEIAKEPPARDIKIMGVLNANEDSFYSGSRYLGNRAIERIERMIEEGAGIIDIGAVSSRPGAKSVSPKDELDRIKPLCDAIKESQLYKNVTFSIDSYTPDVVEYALDSGFKIINDITGAKDERLIKLAKKYSSKIAIMHMQGTPQTMQNNPHYQDVVAEVDAFFKERIEKCKEIGLGIDDIILDVGIGFGKTLEHNLELLRNHSGFLHFGAELLIGASRKSMIDKITPSSVEERLPGTLAIHLKAVDNGATIVRCHDVSEHKQALEVWKAMR